MFDDEDILEQMNELIDDDLVDIEAVSFTSQVVAGTNYDVKYLATNADGEEYFLEARIFEPLPGSGEGPSVTSVSNLA